MTGGDAWAALQAFSPLAWAWKGSGTAVMAAALAVLGALLLDRLWGEPPQCLHPVVLMGQCLAWGGRCVAPRTERPRDWRAAVAGAGLWWVFALCFVALYALWQALGVGLPWWLQGLVLGVGLKPLLSWRMLRDEVLAVEAALQHSLASGRERLSWLVSRDTSALDAGVVRESAIETLAENLNDSVIAPLFWFALLGLPGAALYRWANTADAMWGYPGWRGHGAQLRHWQWAGKWAARADDVLSWLPARLSAALLAVVAGGVGWQALRRCAAATPSPNGGWPMGAMALALDVRLGKPGVYVLHPQGQVPQAAQLHRAVHLAAQVLRVVALLCALCILLGAGVAHV